MLGEGFLLVGGWLLPCPQAVDFRVGPSMCFFFRCSSPYRASPSCRPALRGGGGSPGAKALDGVLPIFYNFGRALYALASSWLV